MARILAVDDEEMVRELVSDALSQAGHHVETADSGKAMITALQKERYEVLVLDMNMPGMTGDEIVELLHSQLDPPIPKIILFSGMEAKPLRRIARYLKVTGWVKKGAQKSELVKAVEAAARFYREENPD